MHNNIARLSHLFGTRLMRNATSRIINMDHVRLIEYDDKKQELRTEYTNGQSVTLRGDRDIYLTNITNVAESSTAHLIFNNISEIQQHHVDPSP
jgi:hypothetical protein